MLAMTTATGRGFTIDEKISLDPAYRRGLLYLVRPQTLALAAKQGQCNKVSSRVLQVKSQTV